MKILSLLMKIYFIVYSAPDLTPNILLILNEFVYQLVCAGQLMMAKLLRNNILEKVKSIRRNNSFQYFKNYAIFVYSFKLSEHIFHGVFLNVFCKRFNFVYVCLFQQIIIFKQQKWVSPNPILPSRAIITSPPSLIDLKSADIAEQMTLLDAELFQKIEIPEVLIWAQEQCEERSPNLTRFTEHFNKMSYWFVFSSFSFKCMEDTKNLYFRSINIIIINYFQF